jgi:hypothetical protein
MDSFLPSSLPDRQYIDDPSATSVCGDNAYMFVGVNHEIVHRILMTLNSAKRLVFPAVDCPFLLVLT